MERISKGLVPPDNVTRSEAFFGVGPGASFFAGIPEIVSGRPKDGWSWGMDEDTGDLVFRAHHAGDAGIDAVKLDLDAETIQFKARTTHYGTLRHFSSAARTWDFPDITGRVLVTDGTVQTGGGAAATLGTIGGSGPGTAAQAIWASIDIGGTQFFIPLWI